MIDWTPIWSSEKCCAIAPHSALVEQAQPEAERSSPAGLAAEEDVGGDVQRRRDREILVDRLDPGSSGLAWRVETHPVAVEADLSVVRLQRARQGLDQRRLAGAVVADDRDDLARVELEVGAVEGHDVPEALDQAARSRIGCGWLMSVSGGSAGRLTPPG